ncbi:MULTISPECIES: phage holin family protein [Yersinia]|uniref:phage holin family protein n=1 Tax=Yersinia TaxID=629 RepID=UPI0011A0A337|nr:phage holin family protein [Yersinia kristensenii]MBW5814461.1 phage holin family protein [Yersinia kristensenii]MBW5816833.1 phage holin family protein [Yersinia kristensenii]MBW5831595.1 phage holin family protein [Yersinia kristensenii]MBW5843068.1 phage holin family protein [Yersinia kristensenii]MDA5489483.1 phage holin family protein [Yersinia kristensenii]
MNNQHLLPETLEALILWAKTNAPVLYGSLAAFGMATLLTLRDGKSWLDALYAGAICLLISLGVINSLELFGMSQDNALLIGVVIGGIGVERCLAILRTFSSMKTNMPMEEKEKPRNDR